MYTFFHGWRRKAGCVTLLMALAFVGGLLRSLSMGDRVFLITGTKTAESIESANHYLVWISWKPSTVFGAFPAAFEWERNPLSNEETRPDNDEAIDYRFRTLLFGGGEKSAGALGNGTFTQRYVSYWVPVIPLTLLSAYLLLAKPRSPAAAKSSEPITDDMLRRQRRKPFIAALVVSLLLIAGWARSFYFADRVSVFDEAHRNLHFLESINGSARWLTFKPPDPLAEPENTEEEEAEHDGNEDELVVPSYNGWQVISRGQEPARFVSDDNPASGFRWRFHLLGFGSGDITSVVGVKSVPGKIWIIPDWSLVLPVFIFLACLVLGKPRHQRSQSIDK